MSPARASLGAVKGFLARAVPNATVIVAAESDVVRARRLGKEISAQAGFASGDQAVIAAAIAAIARNIVAFADTGRMTLTSDNASDQPAFVVIAHDDGPGIPDVPLALREGFSTAGRPGLGLSGARRLMDAFEIVSEPPHLVGRDDPSGGSRSAAP